MREAGYSAWVGGGVFLEREAPLFWTQRHPCARLLLSTQDYCTSFWTMVGTNKLAQGRSWTVVSILIYMI